MSGSDVVIRGGRVIDPASGIDQVLDVALGGGRVQEVGEGLDRPEAEVVDASGLVVAPAFIDLHAHLCEPGDEHRETIATGARAAASGGFGAVCAMPITDPVIDDPASVGFVAAEGRRAGAARVYPISTVSVRAEGEALVEFGEVINAGAVALSDGGRAIRSSALLRLALEYALTFDIPILTHAEDVDLAEGGVIHEGVVSTRLGLRGIPAVAEAIGVSRDLALAEMTGGRIHIQRLTTAAGVALVREAKARGIRVTAEVTPHHLTLSHEDVGGFRTDRKVEPPLRTQADVAALRQGLADGTIDAVASDHAPRHYDEKEAAFGDAPSGVVGRETAFPVLHTRLVAAGQLDLATLIARFSQGPARVLGIDGGTLATGGPADVVVIDPEAEWTIDPAALVSKSKNTAFGGWDVKGRVVATYVGGRRVWPREQ
ncbi:MAG: dihydroorotase [Gemmatimonadetes bacterium]|nr:dihydroorotase [Gemmatimonadota bacterium]